MSTDIEVVNSGNATPNFTAGSTGGGRQVGSTGGGWGDDWRSRMTAGSTNHEKELKQLERYESPEQVWRKARELEQRLSSGDLRSNLAKEATPEEVTRWRQENGIPSKPEEYKIELPAGQQTLKEDDEFLKAFLNSAHGANFTQQQVSAAVNSFYSEVTRQQQFMAESDKRVTAETDEKLRQEWGADYRPNKAMAEALLARAPQGFREKFMNGYLNDRTPISGSPEAWKWLVQMEREINPMATVLPGAGGDVGKTVDAELNDLKKEMANSNSGYWKGSDADSKQARYRDLITAQDKMRAKSGVS